MHSFICTSSSGNILPEDEVKRKLFKKLLNYYETNGMKFKVSIEIITKNINESQVSLYKAFIIKAKDHFNISYSEMENHLKKYWPLISFHQRDYKPVDKWSNENLTDFINKASAELIEHDPNFNF